MRHRLESNNARQYCRPRPLRIVLLANRWWTAGPEVMLAKLVESFRARGHDAFCCLLYDRTDGNNPPPSGTRFLMPGGFRLWALGSAARNLMAVLGRPRPDIVLTFHPKIAVFAQIFAFGMRIRGRITSQRNIATTEKPWLRRIDGLYGTLGIYERIGMVSQSTEDTFAAWPAAFRRRSRVLPNGIVPVTYGSADFPVLSDVPLLVAVGRLAPQKNYAFLLEVVADLPHIQLAVAGEGPDRASLQAQVMRLGLQDRVHFLGALPRDRVNALIARADLFTMPSLYEGMSNALLEALAIGTPIVASDVPAQREVLIDSAGHASGAVLPLEKKTWVAAIQNLLADPDQRQRYADQARIRAETFTMDRCVDRYLSLMQQVVRQRRNPQRVPRSLAIMGHRCDMIEAPTAVRRIISAIAERVPLVVAHLNVNGMVRSIDSLDMQRIYRSADITLIDGLPLIWWARVLGFRAHRHHRVAWLDYLEKILHPVAERGWKVCHIGGKPGIGERTCAYLRDRHPGLDIESRHGHFSFPGPEADALIADLQRMQPRLLLVGMGMPRQEEWVMRYRNCLPTCVVMTTGGTFDYWAGVNRIAPRWLGPLGMEWAFRILTEPRRLWRRYLLEPWGLVPHLLRDLRRGRRR